MRTSIEDYVLKRVLKVICICMGCGLLVVGLWPFAAPKNDVSWLESGSGLHFGAHASAVSAGEFLRSEVGDGEALETWVRPASATQSKTVFSFDGAGGADGSFTVQQKRTALVVRRHNVTNAGEDRTAVFKVDGVFHQNQTRFVAIILKPHSTDVYVDGSLVKVAEIFGLSSNNLIGRLILANSPSADASWSGEFFGMAIYQRQLTQLEVADHYKRWERGPIPEPGDKAMVGSYRFDEQKGEIVHNQIDSATDVVIPTKYSIVHPRFLASPLEPYQWDVPGISYWKDVGLNIAGFIPAGFLFASYFRSSSQTRWYWAALVCGFGISAVIEVLQRFLPTRDSDMTDVITNTMGTVIGIVCYRWAVGSGVRVSGLVKAEGYLRSGTRADAVEYLHPGSEG